MHDFPVYVVTAGHLTERHKHIEKLAKGYDFSFEFIREYDPSDIARSPDLQAKFADDLPVNSISCFLKHFEAQKRLVASNHPYGLILEDDVEFLETSFHDRLNKILTQIPNLGSKWLIFLGGADNKLSARFFLESDPALLLESSMTTAEAYLVNRESCIERLMWFEQTNSIEIALDHLMTSLDKNLGIKHFRPVCALASQGSITGKFETTLDGSRRKHSSTYLYLKYRLNRFRRQLFPRISAKIRAVCGASD